MMGLSLGPVTGRLERAQANLYETLPLFIGAVLITMGVVVVARTA